MFRRKGLILCAVVAALVCSATATWPASAQGLRDILRAQARVFPDVGPGVQALKRDSAGHYFVLAEPATSVLIYNAAGTLVGRIPNANSRGATIRYAVSIDVDTLDRLFVADRGANAIKIFAPDGSPVATIPVNAPTSVVALSGGQFAVTQLQSKRLVQIMDERGAVIRTFGDPANQPDAQPAAAPLADRGRITGDSKGNIYFAFTSLPDPTLQRFDRFGYSAYNAVIGASTFGPVGGRTGHEVDLGYKMSGFGSPETFSAWTDLHSLTSLSVTGGSRRGQRGQAGGATSSPSSPSSASSASSSSSSSSSDQTALPGDVLSYNADDSSGVLSYDSSLFSSLNSNALSPDLGGGPLMPGGFGLGLGFGGGFHPRMPGLFGGGGEGGAGPRPDFGGRPGEENFDRFGHFHPGFGTYRATATLRVELDDPSKHVLEKPVITAVGVDPETQEAWVAISDTLVHFDNFGNWRDIFYLTTPSGASMKPTSILIEPDRILIASDSWGIFEFPRPDKPSPAAPPKGTIVPQQISPAPQPAATR
ncbi:MAG TPA: hypothetical protein VEJ46_15250 [Candidatus Acidoferrum sp.]|nr:hypothetical protein [Candidatus Acidoferrum sp.]